MTNPCVRCTDTTTPCPCPTRLRWEADTLPADPEPKRCHTCSEAEWLALAGELPEQIAARLGIKPATLHYHHSRHGLNLGRTT